MWAPGGGLPSTKTTHPNCPAGAVATHSSSSSFLACRQTEAAPACTHVSCQESGYDKSCCMYSLEAGAKENFASVSN